MAAFNGDHSDWEATSPNRRRSPAPRRGRLGGRIAPPLPLPRHGHGLSGKVTLALQYLATVRNYSPTTLDTYQTAFDQFLDFLRAHALHDDPRQFTGENVHRFIASLAAKHQKTSTIVARLGALSTIAKTLMKLTDDQGRPHLTENPTRTFEWPTVDTPETKFLLPEELAAFLAVTRPVRESIARDLLVDTGLRCSELCRVDVGDVINAEGHTWLAVTVKGRGRRLRKRHVPTSASVASALFEYLMQRGIANPQDATYRDQPLLLSSENHRWKRSALSSLMARIGREAGISRFRVSAHKLRHTANVVARFARRDDGTTIDRWTRSQLLTHANPTSLDRYEHLLPTELLEAREAQRRALGRYLGESTAGVAASPPPQPLAEGDHAARPQNGATGANEDSTRAILRLLLQTLERTTPEQLLALLDPNRSSGVAPGAVDRKQVSGGTRDVLTSGVLEPIVGADFQALS